MNQQKTAIGKIQASAKKQFVWGVVILVIFGMSTFSGLYNPKVVASDGHVPTYILMDALGIFLIVRSKKKKKSIQKFTSYSQALSKDQSGSIQNLSARMNIPQGEVLSDLKQMVRQGFFPGYAIDERGEYLVPSNGMGGRTQMNTNYSEGQQDTMQAETYETITCKNCGGVNKVRKGMAGECEYCGSPLNAN